MVDSWQRTYVNLVINIVYEVMKYLFLTLIIKNVSIAATWCTLLID